MSLTAIYNCYIIKMIDFLQFVIYYYDFRKIYMKQIHFIPFSIHFIPDEILKKQLL